MKRKPKVKPMKLKPYGGKKRKTKGAQCFGRCGVCCKLIDETPKNERVNNRKYKVLKNAEKEYGSGEE